MTKDPSWIGRAAQRARFEPWTMGGLLSQYCELEGSSHSDLAAELGCNLETLHWLYLCKAPSQARFAEDIGLIAERLGLEISGLVAIVRRAEALVALARPGHDVAETGLLLAARDRENKEDPR